MSDSERQACYRSLFASHVEGKLLEDIRAATKSGMALVMKGLKMNWHH
jgi:putative transposase